jgi:hypothetical protein
MSVQPGPTFKRYAANGIAPTYAIPFLLLDAADLQITLDGVLITSGFTLAGIGNPASSCTFTVPPLGDLLFQQVMPFQRLTDYQINGDLLAQTLNPDFDRIWLAVKQLLRDNGRALTAPLLEPEGIPPLPVIASRALRVLAFDALGQPTPSNLTLNQIEQQPALALESAAAAALSASSAISSASAALASKNLAQQWAENPEDTPVIPGFFSAHHWANKAAALAASIGGLFTRVTALEAIGKPLTKEFISAPQIITSGGLLPIAHGLGVIPKIMTVSLVCQTADAGYSVGDVVDSFHSSYVNGASAARGCELLRDATNITVVYGATASTFELINKSTGNITGLANGNWRIVVRAWA